MEILRNNDLPAQNDKLFIPEQNGTEWLPNGPDGFFKLSEGYRTAAITIYKEIKGNEYLGKPFLSCAMIFCFRQFLELRLKELIFFGKKELFKDTNFEKKHNLCILYDDYINNVLPELDPTYDQSQVDIVHNLISEFDQIDPQSMSFRYPVGKKMNPNLRIPNLDIDNFKNVMDRLANYFDGQWELVKLLESYNENMEAEYSAYMNQIMY